MPTSPPPNGLVSPLGSPLGMQFDFELTSDALPVSPFLQDHTRPGTRDGASDNVGKREGDELGGFRVTGGDGQATKGQEVGGVESARLNAGGREAGASNDLDDFARAIELSLSRPTTSGSDVRPQTAGSSINNGTPQFHPSLFPHKAVLESAPASPVQSPMSRAFIDSRDKPYSPTSTPKAPFMMLANNSSPSVLGPGVSGVGLRSPVLPYHPRLSPKIGNQDHFPGTNYSGSTARPSTRASSRSNTITIGTPYQATSSTFPLPQHVQTRPNNENTAAMVAGVKVPTHHTSAAPKAASKAADKPTSKPTTKAATKQSDSKRKTRLLNPLTLLQRRKSVHPTDHGEKERAQREAQAQALARQRDVAISGVNKPPPGFDPRIKGKKVHDFSAPRGKRNTFDETEMPSSQHAVQSPRSPVPTPPMSPMSANGFPPRTASLVNRGPRRGQSETPERRSTHTPVFIEHLGESPEADRRISSIDAENLENKEFLQRASKQSATTSTSQESTILPPFARRSQILDPLQASFYRDDESKRSSDHSTTDKDQDTSLSSLGDVSPITARSSAQNYGATSPSSNGKNSRPVSHMPLNGQAARSSQQLEKPSPHEQGRRSPSEITTNNYWVVMAPPTVETIDESPIDNLPGQLPISQYPSQGPQFASQGIAIRQAGSTSQSPTGRTLSPASQSHAEKISATPTPDTTPDSQSPTTSKKLVEKRASAVGHARRASGTPKKHASNASRFSFQLGESAAQEHALEEKHRKIVSGSGPSQPTPRALSPDEDEDDYFDEDAMDDMDEMEMQSGHTDDQQPAVPQSSLYLHQARQALHVPESDDGSMYDEEIPEVTDERDVPYADHPAFRAHPAMDHHFARNSMLPGGTSDDYQYDGYWRDSTLDSYMRDSYYSSQNSQHSRMQSRGSRITVDTGSPLAQGPSAPSFQDYLSANDGALGSNRLSMPRSNLNISASSPTKPVRPPLPARDSGNSERNRVASGMAFTSNVPTPGSEKSQWIGSDMQSSDHHVRDMSFSTVSEAQSSTAADRANLGGAEKNFYMQPRASIASPDVQSTPRPMDLRLDTSDQGRQFSDGDDPQLTKESVAGFVSSRDSGASKPPQLASPMSAKSFRSDGRRNGSVGGSLASPRSIFSHNTAGSGDFERFAESSGFSRVGSPQTGRDVGDAQPSGVETTKQHHEKSTSDGRADAAHAVNGLGLNMFSEFDFEQPKADTMAIPDVDARRPGSSKKQEQKARFSLFPHQANNGSRPESRGVQKDARSSHLTMPQSNRTTASHYSGFSDASHSTAVPGGAANYSPVRSSMMPNFQFPTVNEPQDDSRDDMYFDDGNFEQDINAPHHSAFDENTFDDDGFLARPGMNMAHRREISSGAFSAASMGSDGPYPTFATPNAVKARQRESQLMLEDLILQDPVDPKLIPQRNPSEDAKRLGLSDRAPPLPIDTSNSKEEVVRMQRTLDNYHAALANAANRAAADGRFWRAPSSASNNSMMDRIGDAKSTYSWDEQSASPNGDNNGDGAPSDANPEHEELKSPPRPSGMAFDFGFNESALDDVNDYDYDEDDDLVAEANAEALASDDEGFYGQEFKFYGRPRANSNELNPSIGGYFGEDGDDGLTRNKSLREPNLTPITERSEFSTRNSMVNLGVGVGGQSLYGPPSAGLYGSQSPALARMSVTPLMESEMSFDELRKLRGQAFGGSSRSLKSNSARSSAQSLEGSLLPGKSGRPGMPMSQQSASYVTGTTFTFPPRTDSNDSSKYPSSVHASMSGQTFHESPQSATSSQGNPFSMDLDTTPRKSSQPTLDPTTAKKISRESILSQSSGQMSHSRKGSGADSVTYVKEPDPDNNGRPRWVMERRRTSEQGQLQLIGRELVQGGWI